MDFLAALVASSGLVFLSGARGAFGSAIAEFSGDTAEPSRVFSEIPALALASLVAVEFANDKLLTMPSLFVMDLLPRVLALTLVGVLFGYV